jgi:uncharacterized tellurite resistance protein B-like protein
MPRLRELMAVYLADGRIDGREVESISALLYADGKINDEEAEFLVQLRRRMERASPAFDRFYFAALKKYILADGVIAPAEVQWLRRAVVADGKATEAEKKLLRELNGEARQTCPQFGALLAECLT